MDKRTILAFILCGIVTSVYFWWLKHSRPPARPEPPAAVVSEPRPSPEVPAESPPPADLEAGPASAAVPSSATAPAAPPEADEEPEADDDIRAGGDGFLYSAVFTNRGAGLSTATLADYRQTLDSDQPFLLLASVPDDLYTFLADSAPDPKTAQKFRDIAKQVPLRSVRSLVLRDPAGKLPFDTRRYEVVAQTPERLVFASTFENGLRVTKEFLPRAGKYEMGIRLTFRNDGPSVRSVQYEMLATARVMPAGGSEVALVGAVGRRESSERVTVERVDPKDARKRPAVVPATPKLPIAWVGASDRYFGAALIPESGKAGRTPDFVEAGIVYYLPLVDAVGSKTGGLSRVDNLYTTLLTRPAELKPGEELTHEYTYFMGPKTSEVLDQHPVIKGLLYYGTFGPVSRLLLAILKLFYRLIPNYGVGIILLTIVVKACLHPLTRKGQVSMHRMQKLTPLIKELQEKYKHDKQRLSREQMELFRKHGANPMSGCMPLLFQLPVFFGLFRMLQNSVELRHAGCIPRWVTDLSAPDTIAHIGSFPINILPVLMVASWVVQQSMMPKPTDPQQAQTQQMMKFMPIIFGVMLYGMASGLTLYWLTSTFLGILEQKLIKIEIARMEAHGEFPEVAAPEPRPARPKGKRK